MLGREKLMHRDGTKCAHGRAIQRWEMAHKLYGGSIYKIKVKMRKKEMSREIKERTERGKMKKVGVWRRGVPLEH